MYVVQVIVHILELMDRNGLTIYYTSITHGLECTYTVHDMIIE